MLSAILKYIVLFSALLLAGSSCRDFSFSSYLKGEAVASVGKATLYEEDIRGIVTPGTDPVDSLRLVNTYVDFWIKQQLKAAAVKRESPETSRRIEKLVDEYRNNLLVHEYETQYIDSRLMKEVSTEEIEDFYNKNSAEFLLSNPVARGFILCLPSGFRQESKLKELARTRNGGWEQDMKDLAVKNGLEWSEFTKWTDLRELTAAAPGMTEELFSRIGTGSSADYKYGGEQVMVVITDYLGEGNPMPLSMVAEPIATRILANRKQDLIRSMEDSLYTSAFDQGDITINTK